MRLGLLAEESLCNNPSTFAPCHWVDQAYGLTSFIIPLFEGKIMKTGHTADFCSVCVVSGLWGYLFRLVGAFALS